VYWSRSGNDLCFTFRGQDHRFSDRTLEPATVVSAASDGRIRASTSGRVVAIHASIGDTLAAGQAVFTLEAMKMEHTHTAPIAGTLRALDLELGAQVSLSRVVARIEPQQVDA
jgi:geranyl-CoA carboxylase alpha subunit